MAEEWSPAQREQGFEEFWSRYPRKVGKFTSRQKWARIVASRVVFEAILDYIERQKRSEQWRDIRFIPHPVTVLNQRRWEDDVQAYIVSGSGTANAATAWFCDHEPRCGNRETCAVVASRVCPHTPACAKRTECLERIVSQWR